MTAFNKFSVEVIVEMFPIVSREVINNCKDVKIN